MGNLTKSTGSSIVALMTFLSATHAHGALDGYLDYVNPWWIVGWACDDNNFTHDVVVELYATNTSGDGTCQTLQGQQACRVAQSVADSRRPGDVATQCGGDDYKGFRFPAPQYLLDTESHTLYVIAFDYAGSVPHELSGSGAFDFDSDVLYVQEPIDYVDDHLFLDGALANSPGAAAEYPFYAFNRLLFIYDADGGPNPFASHVGASSVAGYTGFAVPSSYAPWQIGIDGSSQQLPGQYTAFQGYHNGAGLLIETQVLGNEQDEMHLQVRWPAPYPKVFRANEGSDTLRVSAYVRQPLEFADDTSSSGSVDNMSFWYFVLYFEVPGAPTEGVWFTVPVYNSRTATTAYWAGWSDGITETTYGGVPAVDPGAYHLTSPLASTSSWLTPCPGSSLYTQDPWVGERYFCFEVDSDQFASVLADMAPKVAGLETDPSAYHLKFALIDAEAWAIGGERGGLGLSVREFKFERIRASVNKNPWGYVNISNGTDIKGWVCDADEYRKQLDIHVYATNIPGCEDPGDPPCFLTSTIADVTKSAAVAANCGNDPDHGFSIPITSELNDGESHQITVKAINVPTGPNLDLIGSPLTYP